MRPSSGPPGRAIAAGAAEFDELLAQASAGRISSDRAVRSAEAALEGLTEAQQQRLSAAADVAEAAGFDTALIILDDRAIILDVPQRSIVRDAQPDDKPRALNVDGAVIAAGEGAAAAAATASGPGRGAPPHWLPSRE